MLCDPTYVPRALEITPSFVQIRVYRETRYHQANLGGAGWVGVLQMVKMKNGVEVRRNY